jgi:UDP-glucuronate 4-epimerase
MASTCLVTGVAGFVGSSLAEHLVADGHKVTGVDCFTDYYPRGAKEANLANLAGTDGFTFLDQDLLLADCRQLIDGVDYVFHLAGQPGVRESWGENFDAYVEANILVTQRLLEAAVEAKLRRFVYASSSSIYGNAPELPTTEVTLPRPVSPYGVTKLAAEHLCGLYAENLGVPTISLRYFTVYGPRQRPDMAFNKFIRAILAGEEIAVHGDGEQTRDFTYVADIVRATVAAAFASEGIPAGSVYNLGGGVRTTVNHVIEILGAVLESHPRVRQVERQRGDARHTYADCSAAARDLGYAPAWTLEQGLRAEALWLRKRSNS